MSAARRSVPAMRCIVLDGPRGERWRVEVPTSRRERLRGLRGRPPPAGRRGMLFHRCRSVHTFGMPVPITVAGLDRRLRVVVVRTMAPGRVLFPRPGVRHILECPADLDVRNGDRFEPARPERRRRGSTGGA